LPARIPHKSCIAAPGALHHVKACSISRRSIFDDDEDRDRFVARLGGLLLESGTGCYAWTLMPNHFHLLLCAGRMPLVKVRRGLFTGHAFTYNAFSDFDYRGLIDNVEHNPHSEREAKLFIGDFKVRVEK
jgi:REP element-mobilizing transposase RayT